MLARRRARAKQKHLRRLGIAQHADELYDLLDRITRDHPCENPQCIDYRAEIRDALHRIDPNR